MAIFARENAASRCLTEHYVWQIVTATGVKTLFSILYSCHVFNILKMFFTLPTFLLLKTFASFPTCVHGQCNMAVL